MKNLVLIIVVTIVVLYLIRNKTTSRESMIDLLNTQVGYEGGVWARMTDEDLKTVYKFFALIKQNVKPSQTDYLNAVQVGKKYKIEGFLM